MKILNRVIVANPEAVRREKFQVMEKSKIKRTAMASLTALSLIGGFTEKATALNEVLSSAKIEVLENHTQNLNQDQPFCVDLSAKVQVQKAGDTACADCSCGDGSCSDGSCGCDGSC